MTAYDVALVAATLLCGLVAGFLFAFALVVMPGLRGLGDREYVEAFARMDRIIQDSHPVFVVVWVGSILTVVAAAVLGLLDDRPGQWPVFLAAVVWVLGVQGPTFAANIPRNNALQAAYAAGADAGETRRAFEPGWVRANLLRTVLAVVTVLLLLLAR